MKDLIAYAARLRFEDLPPEAVAAARAVTLDAIACAILGSSAPMTAEIVERHARWGGAPEATVLVHGNRLPAPTAAWLNSVLVHANDFDDTHDPTQNHVFCTIFPAALAALESLGRPVSGRELIAALAAGVEVMLRVNAAVHPHLHRGWLPTTVFGCIGAAVASAKILGLDEEGLADAAGIAYAQSHGNRQALVEGVLTKRIQPAFSARGGLHAAVLAQIGISGPRDIVEGQNGILALFGGGRGDGAPLTQDLGKTHAICELSLKPFPCCRAAHPVITAAIEARRQFGAVQADDVESLDAWITPICHSMVGHPFALRKNPQVDAQFSAAWTAAFGLLRGAPGPRDFFSENVLAARDVCELAGRVKVHPWGEGSLKMAPARVAAKLRTGRIVDVTHRRIKGSPEWPLTPEERREKFLGCAEMASPRLDAARVEKALSVLEGLEAVNDVGNFIRGFGPTR